MITKKLQRQSECFYICRLFRLRFDRDEHVKLIHYPTQFICNTNKLTAVDNTTKSCKVTVVWWLACPTAAREVPGSTHAVKSFCVFHENSVRYSAVVLTPAMLLCLPPSTER